MSAVLITLVLSLLPQDVRRLPLLFRDAYAFNIKDANLRACEVESTGKYSGLSQSFPVIASCAAFFTLQGIHTSRDLSGSDYLSNNAVPN